MAEKELICNDDSGVCTVVNAKTTKKQITSVSQDDFDKNITEMYGTCDAKLPIIGNVCDTLNTSTGIMRIVVILTAIPLIGFVLFMDIFGDWIVIVTTTLAEVLDGVPVLGTIFSAIEAPEFDDIFDFLSMTIVFYYCGPVTLIGIPEFAEGWLEIFPFWTTILLVWLLLIRPSRRRMIRNKQLEDLKLEEELKPLEKR